ncbi:hypothetical protein K492DRAFT_210525 [Lichtheimia hyalospora FSU 10163]|nr:hypothetical protein K492DRAFT_210525 [Lichtheimia hyalospora FSU 10163]
MTLSIDLDNICENDIITSAHHQQGDKVIDQFTCQLMEKLNERAATLTREAQFDLALQDAALMIRIVPSSAVGYLRAGNIYQQQGRQRAAVMIYEQGLDTVSPSQPGYTQLHQYRSYALEVEDSKRVDFIRRLPMEIIVINIVPLLLDPLEPMTLDQRYPYLSVSTTWRQRILQANVLKFSLDSSLAITCYRYDQLIRYAPHIKSFTMYGHPCKTSPNDIMDLFINGQFSTLQHLDVELQSEHNYMHMLMCLEPVNPTLTHLKVAILGTRYQACGVIHLSDILERCPHLVSLDMEWFDIGMPLTLFNTHTKLTHLRLNDMTGYIGIYDWLSDILDHLPSLSSFCVYPVPDVRLLPTIHEQCPDLKVLRYGCKFNKSQGVNHDHSGLQQLSIGLDGTKHDMGEIISTLIHYSESLETFDMDGLWLAQDTDVLIPNDPCVFRRLSKLDITTNNCWLASWIIHHAPYLDHINIDRTVDGGVDDVLNAITRLSQLQSLSLRPAPSYSRPLHHLLNNHVQLGDASTLHALKLNIDTHIKQSCWLVSLTQLAQLQSLELEISPYLPPSDFKSIMSTLAQGCSALESLGLKCYLADIPAGVISALHAHPTLQQLIIHAESITDKDILSTFKFQKLQSLVLDVPIKDYILESLRVQIPHVDYQRGSFE